MFLAAPLTSGQAIGTNDRVEDQAVKDSWKMSPRDAVVLDTNLIFKISSCAMGSHTDYAWIDASQEYPRFAVAWPQRRHVWIGSPLIPIDINVYPILVLTYRAHGTEQNRFWDYHVDLFTDAGMGSPYRGIRVANPETSTPLIADGQLREFRIDTREIEIKPESGVFATRPFTHIWVGTRSGLEVPATFDLVGLRLEATDKTRLPEAYADEQPVRLRVTDPAGRPVGDAQVTVDAQRINFARTGRTDRFGYVTLTPQGNATGQHTVRVEKDGWMRTEFDGLQVAGDGAVPLVVERAVVYRGQIIDERGAGIPNVSVRMYPADSRHAGASPGRVLTRTAVATGPDGRWQSPPMPARIEQMCLRYTHTGYVSDRHAEVKPGHDRDQLIREYPVAVMRDGLQLHGRITPAAGQTLEGVKTELVVDGMRKPLPGWVHEDGTYGHGAIEPGRGQLVVKATGHQDYTVDFSGGAGRLELGVQLVEE